VKPYYERDGITIYCGDCRSEMRLLFHASTERADVLFGDPPYGETSLDWDEADWKWLQLARDLVTPTASFWCFGSMRMFLYWHEAIRVEGWRFVQDLVWEKQNGTNFHADRFRRVHEHLVQFVPINVAWERIYKSPVTTSDAVAKTVRRKERPTHTGEIANSTYISEDGGPRLMRSVLQMPNCHGHAVHPTQKPVALIAAALQYSLPAGGLVLDPTCGSGSTLVAAKQLGCRAIGIEINEGYCRSAVERLEEMLPFQWEDAADPRPVQRELMS
jgi:site-specific DNA-methyltransferase (adenine-specific)